MMGTLKKDGLSTLKSIRCEVGELEQEDSASGESLKVSYRACCET